MIVDVSAGMTLAQVIMRLREAHGASVTIRILPESALLLTANEFRALSLAAEREQIAIAVETDDALRRQLANLFGVPLAIPIVSGEPVPEIASDVAEPIPLRPREATDAVRALASTEHEELDQTGIAIEGNRINGTRAGVAPRRQTRKRLGLLAALAGVVLLSVAGYWWFFGTATVTLTLVPQPVTANVSFEVVAAGAAPSNGGLVIPAEPVSFDLTVTLEAPATGVMTIGDQSAEGTIVLRNPGSDQVEIPAGFTFSTYEGSTFVFPDAVSVPPATPQGGAGETNAAVAAATPGAEGNRDLGMLSGQLENGVYFSNRTTPVAGGANVTVTVVSEEDLASLRAQAERALTSLASTSSLSGNRRVVPSSLVQQKLNAEFSAEAGAEVDTVTATVTVTFDALAFATDQLTTEAEPALRAVVPAGYELIPESFTFDVPIETGELNGSRSLLIPVSGKVVPVLSDGDIQQIADDLAGKSEAEAIDYLDANDRFAAFNLEFSPGWAPDRMPSDADRITVTIA